jgi:hypothetical protein
LRKKGACFQAFRRTKSAAIFTRRWKISFLYPRKALPLAFPTTSAHTFTSKKTAKRPTLTFFFFLKGAGKDFFCEWSEGERASEPVYGVDFFIAADRPFLHPSGGYKLLTTSLSQPFCNQQQCLPYHPAHGATKRIKLVNERQKTSGFPPKKPTFVFYFASC